MTREELKEYREEVQRYVQSRLDFVNSLLKDAPNSISLRRDRETLEGCISILDHPGCTRAVASDIGCACTKGVQSHHLDQQITTHGFDYSAIVYRQEAEEDGKHIQAFPFYREGNKRPVLRAFLSQQLTKPDYSCWWD